jgi:hypothetical protein
MLSSMPNLGILDSWDMKEDGDLLNNFLKQFWTFIQYQMFSGTVSRILTYFLFKLLLDLVEKISKMLSKICVILVFVGKLLSETHILNC